MLNVSPEDTNLITLRHNGYARVMSSRLTQVRFHMLQRQAFAHQAARQVLSEQPSSVLGYELAVLTIPEARAS